MKNLLFIFGLSLSLFSIAYADITGVFGTVSDGESITISGSDFGTKTNATPIAWTGDEIDAGTSGQAVSLTNFSQVSVSEVTTVYSNTQSHTGNSLLFDLDRDDNWSQYMLDMGAGQTVVFLTMWFRIEYTDTCDSYQWKSWRLRSDTDYLHSNGTTAMNDWWYSEDTGNWFNSGNLQVYYNSGTWGGSINATADQALWDTWQRVEAYYVMSTPSTADGVTWLRRVGRSGDMLSSSSLTTRDSDDPLWRYIRFGQAYSNPTSCGTQTGGLKIYLDDIYVDNTQARVEIGDNSVFANCTHREIQIPSAWSSTSITATVNTGSFSDGTAYLFVIDSDGTASSGYEITIGAGESPTNTNITGGSITGSSIQ